MHMKSALEAYARPIIITQAQKARLHAHVACVMLKCMLCYKVLLDSRVFAIAMSAYYMVLSI